MQAARMSRAQALRALACGGAAVAAGAAYGARNGAATSVAAPSADTDAEILNVFLLLEHVQEGFYREAVNGKRLSGPLLAFATTLAHQEAQHVAFLAERLGERARPRPGSDFASMVDSPEAFRDAAIELEEAAIAAYVGQGANLRRRTVAAIAPLVSVEARQAAWIRSLAGVSPAPRAADPARKVDSVVADLRERGFLR
jgi:hypothetical protein